MKLSFRTMLLTVLVILLLSTVISLGFNAYLSSRETARDLTFKLLDQTSLAIDQQIRGLLNHADHLGDFTQRMIRAKALEPDNPAAVLRQLRALMESSPSLTGVFLGREPFGECLGLSRRKGDQLAVWELRKNPSTSKLEIREYELDNYPNKPFRVELSGDFADTRHRPWYVDANQSGKQVWSRAYPFFLFSGVATVPGITCATPLYDDADRLIGVLGIDIRLDRLCDFLRTLQVGDEGFPFVVELNTDGTRHVIAHPDPKIILRNVSGPDGTVDTELMAPEDISDRRIAAFMARVPPGLNASSDSQSTLVRFLDGAVPYLGTYRVMSGPELPTWLLCTVVPEDEVLARARADTRRAAIIGLGILFSAVMVSVLVSGNLTRSLVKLVRETRAVGQFQVEARTPVRSMMLEIDHLARATEQMKTNLRSFGKYVPTDLVRQLLASGLEAVPGGENRILTIFFCDLANFTSISEGLNPQELVEQLGEYFHAVAEEVAASGGTLDKFIGDAVMAFWNAPVENPDHAAAACRCALGCQRRLAKLRVSWKEQDKPLMFCRIGINTGPVVVGNIGSVRRFNYTVIGDAVNVASRLEGLNKFYGTGICISEETFQAAGSSMVVRPIDLVSVKGKSTPILVYELLGLKSEVSADEKRLAEMHQRGLENYRRREWPAAISEFDEILRMRPGDGPATELRRRCRAFQSQPPGPDWDGVNRLDSK